MNEKATKRQPYRVFISSTYLDNVERRQLVENAVLQAGMHPVGMERFTASSHPTVAECERLAAECDLYVGILAHRYGWIPEGHSVSITELEYDAAKGAERARYVFFIAADIRVDPSSDFDDGRDRWRKQELLEAFRAKCSKDQLPGRFHDNTLQAKVLEALYKWRQENESTDEPAPIGAPAPPPVAEGEVERYRRVLDANHGSLLLAGFATKLRVPLDLEELYVPLHAMVDLRGVGDAHFADATEAEERLAGQAQDIALVNAFRVAKLRKRKAMVILGDPGSGKTTHLKRLLLYCLHNGAHELGLSAELVPVFLPLRELRGSLDLQAFIEKQLDGPHRELAAGFGKRLLDRGRLLLLFDGLDELADINERQAVAKWIEQAVRNRPHCMVVVTSRFAGYGGAARFGADFLELHLRPLSRDQAEAFIRNWYKIVETALTPDPGLGPIHAAQRADDLIERLRQGDFRSARLVTMTRNPLLLANLCLVHRDRGSLPTGRAQLYRECIDVLLEHWRQDKGLTIEVTAEAGRRSLQPAALWLHSEANRTRASAEQLAPVLAPALAAVQYQGAGAIEFLRTVRDASGLLTGWGQDQYGFMHLGFQEYLAACELRRMILEGDTEAVRMLVDGYGQSWWQEVILVLVALGNPSAFVPFMRAIVQRDAFTSAQDLLDLIFEDAAEVSALPLVELVREAPGTDRKLWARQLVALRVLGQHFASTLPELQTLLAQHPSAEVRAWLGKRQTAAVTATGDTRTSAAAVIISSIVSDNGGVELVLVPGGSFVMGSPQSDKESFDDERPQHEVTVSSFYLGRYPVTNEEYGRFLKAHPDVDEPKYWSARSFNRARQPVVGVSWEDAARFAAWAGGRLPTEAEWEYVCRAGTTKSRYGMLDDIAWYESNSEGHTHSVGAKQPNALGLHDMLGNVWEWCSDRFAPFQTGPMHDPSGPTAGSGRVIRGGAWYSDARLVRVACRDGFKPGQRGDGLGFRLARGESQAGMSTAEPATQSA